MSAKSTPRSIGAGRRPSGRNLSTGTIVRMQRDELEDEIRILGGDPDDDRTDQQLRDDLCELIEQSASGEAKDELEALRSRSGPNLSEARRAQLGYGSIKLRLPLDTLARLGELADTADLSRAELVDSLIRGAKLSR